MNASVTASAGPIEWLGSVREPVSAVGGKGASLDRLARLGFLIPPGFCLSTAAFTSHRAAVAARSTLEEAIGALPDDDARSVVVELIRESRSPEALRVALDAALRQLVEAGETSFAVRSSALGEDGTVASYAGLHDTELGLGAADVEPAVRRCWSSLFSAPALAYRQRRSLPLEGAAMAVVVQALVPADAAAVAFTRHPVTRRDDQLVITAVRGLGEPMVSGTATPDTWVIDKASGTTVEYEPGDGAERLVAVEGGVERLTGHRADGGPALGEWALRELVRLAVEVERAFGAPVDIEAAFARDRWYLLQARPITSA